MTKPKKKSASPTFTARPHPLSEQAKLAVVEALGYQSHEAQTLAVQKVEMATGIYVNARNHIDEMPRSGDYLAAFKPLKNDAEKLLLSIEGMNGYFRDQFEFKGENIYDITTAIIKIIGVSDAVLKDMKDESGKGAPKEAALYLVIHQLGGIYELYKNPSHSGGSFEFIKIAMIDARILMRKPATPNVPAEQQEIDFDKKLKRYILQSVRREINSPRQF